MDVSRIRDILCILFLALNEAVSCLKPAGENVCLTVRLEHLSSCEAFILYSNRCAEFFDSQVCEIVHSESMDTGTLDVSVDNATLLLYTCCSGFTHDVSDCSQACQNNTFGLGCHGECQCQYGATCNPDDGSCACPVGWTGQYCERPCTEGFYGDGCIQPCPDCNKDSYCDHVDGHCICTHGFEGDLCNDTCTAGSNGTSCGDICHLCQDNCDYSEYDMPTCCDVQEQHCRCGHGWTGHYCTEPCEIGKFGKFCDNTCQCENDAICLHENGVCLCMRGWKGTLCGEPCEQGFYGNQCLEKCNCPNNSSCDHVTGVCHCEGDWQGPRCNEVSSCKPGENCQPANGTCIADDEAPLPEPIPPIKVGIAAAAGASTFLFLVIFAINCMKRTRVQSSSYNMETKIPLYSNGPKPPPRPAVTTIPFNNEPVYDSIDGHYLEIIDGKPSGYCNPEYIISGGEGYLIPSQKLVLPNNEDTKSVKDNSSHSARSSSSFNSASSFDGTDDCSLSKENNTSEI